MTEIYDITIIGAGPVGLFTGFYAGLRQAKVKIIDSLEQIGGQPHHLYPEKFIYDVPGYPKINGHDLAERLYEQLTLFPHTLCLGETVTDLAYDDIQNMYHIHTSKQIHFSKTIIIAAGNGAFSPKKLSLANAPIYESKQLHYYVKPLSYYANRRVAILGGGDSAVDWALSIKDVASKVYLIHRRDKFRALESSVVALRVSEVDVFTPYVLEEIHGDKENLQAITLSKVKSNDIINIDIDDLIVSYGFSSSMGPIRQWDLTLERNGISVNSQFQTNRPGIFAVGDIANYPGKLKLIATGFGEAPMAVNQALLYINPNNAHPPTHSSDLF